MPIDPTLPTLPFGPIQVIVVAVLTAAALAWHAVTTLYLMQILNRAFDPFWVPQMLHPPAGFRQRYKWTLFYSGAVVSRTVRQTIFENKPYDFRARITRTTWAVCVMHHLFGALATLGLLALSSYGLWELWLWWQAQPTPAPPKIELPDIELP